jgi:anaerobic selenocysteine-containing dehydrogenase
MGYLNYAQDMGWIQNNKQIVLQLYSEVLQKFRLAARGHGDIQPPESERERIETFFDPLPLWHRPFEEDAVSETDFPLHALTQRPMQMYHSWGSQNAWLRQITTRNRLYMACQMSLKLAVGDEDWVWVVSHHGRVKAQVKLMDGVNPDTVWTWNAIGKRKGAWALDGDAPESRKGFLLNHIISQLLPTPSPAKRPGSICGCESKNARPMKPVRPNRCSRRCPARLASAKGGPQHCITARS